MPSWKTIFRWHGAVVIAPGHLNIVFQRTLAELENDIQMARRYYNGTVREQNNRIMQFPGNLVAGRFGFEPMEYFELSSEKEAEAPRGYPG